MGSIINFPEARRVGREAQAGDSQSATIMILPVVRIERVSTDPPDAASPHDNSTSRKRRRRARRS
jgi:hypothetical protein